jgi:hypothetical protein
MVRVAFRHKLGGPPLPAWPECIPIENRPRLVAHTGLRDRLNALKVAVANSSIPEVTNALALLDTMNQFPALLSDLIEVPSLDSLGANLCASIDSLYRFAFGLLTDLNIRDSHYTSIYNGLQSKVCPFCGYENFEAPGSPRHDYDHYLPISRYPFLGCDLRNLVPMGDRCNRLYKKDKDVIHLEGGERATAFYPYGEAFGELSLAACDFKPEENPRQPLWNLELVGGDPAETWERGWGIKSRVQTSILDANFKGWLDTFARYHSDQNSDGNVQTLAVSLSRYMSIDYHPGYSDSAYFKRLFYSMLYDCVTIHANADVIDFLELLVADASGSVIG